MYSAPIEMHYNGFRISGDAQPVAMGDKRWFAVGEVLLAKPDRSVLLVDRFLDDNLIYDDEVLSKWFGLGMAEIMVDHCLPPAEYFFLQMNVGWAVDILRRAAADCKEREIRVSKLYEALDFLEHLLNPNKLVRRYRQELRWDRRNEREKEELREILRVTTQGIQHACTKYLVDRLNDLGKNYRGNVDEIKSLRRQLEIVRRPLGR
jgi:hypothetical protein